MWWAAGVATVVGSGGVDEVVGSVATVMGSVCNEVGGVDVHA